MTYSFFLILHQHFLESNKSLGFPVTCLEHLAENSKIVKLVYKKIYTVVLGHTCNNFICHLWKTSNRRDATFWCDLWVNIDLLNWYPSASYKLWFGRKIYWKNKACVTYGPPYPCYLYTYYRGRQSRGCFKSPYFNENHQRNEVVYQQINCVLSSYLTVFLSYWVWKQSTKFTLSHYM